ncbi:hypothetical protein K1T71_006973 [Dendrolimus kikuchii]|uniref:Uncharacterized protein n=1 Tax=Dendrolimus kikuchii TaxID=765133 RepID=A0ACC1CZR5_9NEOP|nr:hypothetical protein K1T71_006973 [Dendrolimus kikuchii]
MLSEVLLLFCFPPLMFGLQLSGINLSIEYFRYRDLNYICYLSCGNSVAWELAKTASEQLIAISVTSPDANDYGGVKRCLKQTLPTGVLLDTNCLDSQDILFYASENMLFDDTHKWLLINNGNDSIEETNNTKVIINDHYVETLKNLNLSVNADIILAKRIDSFKYVLYDVYNFGKIQSSELIIEKIGSWTEKTGMKQFDLFIRTYMLIDRRPMPGIAFITKSALMSLRVIAEIHNIQFVYTITDRWIGTFERNSTRVVANSLYHKEQDMTPVLRQLKILDNKIDFLHTSMTSIETRYYYRIPTYGVGKFENQFLRPLTFGAWVCVIAVITLCSLVLLLSAILEQRSASVQYAIFSVIASFCQQFFEDFDDNQSTRFRTARKLTILVTGLSCVLIYNYYTSSVVSWLLSGPPPSINSLRELIDSPLELIYEDIGYTRSWMQVPMYYYNKRNAILENELREKKVFKRTEAQVFRSLEEGIAMVKLGGFAYHTEVNSANNLISRTFTQRELCELGSLHSMEKTLLFPCVQKNSPYKEFFSWSLLHLAERGIISCVQRRTRHQELTCEGSSPRAMDLGGSAPAFILLFGGYVLGVIIMVIERGYITKLTINFKRKHDKDNYATK